MDVQVSEFGSVRFAPGVPRTPLGIDHDPPGLTTLTCPRCNWAWRVYDYQADYSLSGHMEDCRDS